MSIVNDMQDKEKAKEKKKRILNFLKSEGIILEHDTGSIIIHLNDGAISDINKNICVLR